jgi:predicted dehydrogenase
VTTAPLRVGVVGCGVISDRYVENSATFPTFEVISCADRDRAAADRLASKFGLERLSIDELLADPGIDIVLNLTPPQAHVAVTTGALEAGKHVYSEKPVALTVDAASELLAKAEQRGLRIGCAPDIFLGAPYQKARALLDDGAIGEPLSVSAAMLVGGQTTWHPNPDIFFADGAGPLLDMGPYYLTAIVALLGPVARVAGFASTRLADQVIEIGPRAGEHFTTETPTHTAATLELASGVTANFVASFEAPGQYVCDLVVHGSSGVLELPDPNAFNGPIRVREKRDEVVDVPFAPRDGQDARGIGLHDLALAIAEGRPHRASGQLACHVVDVARTILAAAEAGRVLEVGTRVERPAAFAQHA